MDTTTIVLLLAAIVTVGTRSIDIVVVLARALST